MTQDMEGLRQAISREAERDRQRILGEARVTAEAIRQKAQAEAAEEAAHLVEVAEAKAARIRQETVGVAGLDAQAVKVRARESALELVFSRASESLEALSDPGRQSGQNRRSEPAGWAAIVEGLLVDAIGHFGRVALVVHADPETHAILEHTGEAPSMLDRIGQQVGCQLTLGQLLLGGTGVIVESPDGHLRYDNTLQTRLARMRSGLRAPVYRILVGDNP
ncbi:MAG: V-type ATP synthase subunit E family protein [Anaerolineae bacterium]|jgi:V/A-type H+-transporting ATPase subunit E|nr:V-type ATP synthase subunit E family protein [Anaerolineae bacterium]